MKVHAENTAPEAWLTKSEVMSLINCSERTVQRKCKIREWTIKTVTAQGGSQYRILLNSLPLHAQKKYWDNRISNSDIIPSREGTPTVYRGQGCVTKSSDLNDLKEADKKLALARANLLIKYLDYANSDSGSKLRAKYRFLDLYNSGAFASLLEITGEVTFKTVERWKKDYLKANMDYRVLANRKPSGKHSVTKEESDTILKLALNPNQPLISEIIRKAREIFRIKNIPHIKSEKSYRSWLEKWKNKNYDLWVFYREGKKALNDKVLPFVIRNYDLLEVGDVVVADGHTLNFEIINPFTGKPKRMTMILFFDMKSSYPLGWEIAPTENTQSIAAALYRAILRLGKYPKVVYLDNGRAFASKFFNGSSFEESDIPGLFQRIGVKVINAWAYHGQSKTVERFFRTFAELERMLPTYSGTSIQLKPPRMNRGEKLHSSVYERLNRDFTMDLWTAHKAIAWWFDQYVNRPQQNGHLKNISPAQVFEYGKGTGVDKKELSFLMMEEEVKQLTRNGVRFLNEYYWNEELYGLKEKVYIRYDLQNREHVYVFDQHKNFICTATRKPEIHPMAGPLGTDEDVNALRNELNIKKSLQKSTEAPAREFLIKEMSSAVHKQLEDAEIVRLENSEEPVKKPAAKKKINPIDLLPKYEPEKPRLSIMDIMKNTG